MKKYLFIAASALALASCSSEDFVGTEGGNVETGANQAINFAGETGKTTRAANGNKGGADAADLLGKKFYVLGTKGTLPTYSPTKDKVFDNYQVEWGEKTAGTTSDNTNDWKYAGLDFVALNKNHSGTHQTIKYWDYSVPQYDFIAYSIGGNTLVTDENATLNENEVYGSPIVTPNEENVATGAKYASYTLKASKIEDLKECYYTDVTTVEKKNYKQPVKFTFKNLTAKVRVAFYETVPGYSVKDLHFYSDDNGRTELTTEDSKEATLYTTGTEDFVAKNGEITVTYPVVGATAKNTNTTGYNKAFVSVNPNGTDKVTKLALGSVNYAKDSKLATSAKTASMAGKKTDGYYTAVLPTETKGKPLTLRMNYTLVSDDGSNETIKVYGAKAVIPASYTQWQPNYAYTYIFKISDNTNGATSTDQTTPDGLFPITFDAVVADIDNVDFNQETITTVSTPSVTSYAFDTDKKVVIKAYETGNEYPATTNTDIYFSVAEDGAAKTNLDKNGQLYSIDEKHNTATEAEVIDALQVIGSTSATSITGRNGVILTKVDTEKPSTIPTEDGKTIVVTQNSVAKFTANATPTTYAYVYTKSQGEATYILSAVIIKEGETITARKNEYYKDPSGKEEYVIEEGTTLTPGIYYKKYTNNNNVYGVKVVKTYKKN